MTFRGITCDKLTCSSLCCLQFCSLQIWSSVTLYVTLYLLFLSDVWFTV